MPTIKISELPQATRAASSDLLVIVKQLSATPETQSLSAGSIFLYERGADGYNSIQPVLGDNITLGEYANVVSGDQNSALGSHTSIGNGTCNGGDSPYSTIVNGLSNTMWSMGGGIGSFIGGGECNCAVGQFSFIGTGKCNIASGHYSAIIGGINNDTNNVTNAYILGSNLTASLSDHTYVNNLSTRGSIHGKYYGDGSNLTGIAEYISIPGMYKQGTDIGSIVPLSGNNTASNQYASVLGGTNNSAEGYFSIIAGGGCNTANNSFTTVGGGTCNVAIGHGSTIAGGGGCFYSSQGGWQCYGNCAEGPASTIGGGYANYANSSKGSTIGGGHHNRIPRAGSNYSVTIGGGSYNTAYGSVATIAGGCGHVASGAHSTIAGGISATTSGYASFIGGGESNITGNQYDAIVGGFSNAINIPGPTNAYGYSFIGAGCLNVIDGESSVIGGGSNNCIIGDSFCSSILGGYGNTIETLNNVHIIGSNITADSANYTYVNNLSSQGKIFGQLDRLNNETSQVILSSDNFLHLPTGILGDTFGDGGITLMNNPGSWSGLASRDGNVYAWVADEEYNNPTGGGFSIQTNALTGSHQWSFGNDGLMRFPDGSIQTTAVPDRLGNSSYQLYLSADGTIQLKNSADASFNTYIKMTGPDGNPAGYIDTSSHDEPGGYINTSGTSYYAGGYINTSSGIYGLGGCIDTSSGGGSIITRGSSIVNNPGTGGGGSINTSVGTGDNILGGIGGSGGSILLYGGCATRWDAGDGGTIDMRGGNSLQGSVGKHGGCITTSAGGGSINTTGSGYIQFGYDTTRTTLSGTATSNRVVKLPDASGTLALASNLISVSGTPNQVNAAINGTTVTLSLPTSAVFPGDVNIQGNLTIAGSAAYINTKNLVVNDNLIYFAASNPANSLDIGIVGHFTQSPLGYNHSGLVRRSGGSTPGTWTLFSGLTSEPLTATNIDWSDKNIRLDSLSANLIGNADTVTNGVYTNGSYSDPSWITSLADTKITGTKFATNTLLQTTSANLVTNTLLQTTSAKLVTNTLLQTTSANLVTNTLLQTTSAKLVTNTLLQSTSANLLPITTYQSSSSSFVQVPSPSIVATFQNSNQTLRIFTTEDYGATLTEIGQGTSLVGGSFVRDPSLLYLNGDYYVAATNGWDSNKDIAAGRPASFSIFKSSDLANWTLHTTVSAPNANAVSVWSPCFFTDTDDSVHTIFSASSSLDGGGYANNNRFYYTRPVTSGDLSTWTTPVSVTLTGSPYVYNMFGAATIKVGATYNLFFISAPPGGAVFRATASSIAGPYTVDPSYPNTCNIPYADGIVNVNKLPNGIYRMIVTLGSPYAAKIFDSTDLNTWTDKGWLGGDFGQNLWTANNTSGLNNASMIQLPLSAKALLATKGAPVTYQSSATELNSINKNQGSTSTSGTILASTLPTLTVTLTGSVGTTSVSGNVISSTGSYSLSSGMTLWFDGTTGDVNPSPYIGEFQITKTGGSKFTFNTNRPVAVAKPSGTLTAKNYWVTLFEGYGGASMAGLLTVSTNAAGSRHRCVLAISTGGGGSDQPDIRVLTSSGYSFLSHVRVSTLGDNSGWVKIEARPAGAAGYDTAISATYQSLMGQCIPGIKPLKWGSNGPLAYSTRKFTGVGGSNPRIINNWKMDLPAVNGGSYSYIYPGLQNNGTPDGPLTPSYEASTQLDNMPSYTFNAHYPGLPERLILTNLGQGAEGANWLTVQLYNPSSTVTTATTVYGTLTINYGA